MRRPEFKHSSGEGDALFNSGVSPYVLATPISQMQTLEFDFASLVTSPYAGSDFQIVSYASPIGGAGINPTSGAMYMFAFGQPSGPFTVNVRYYADNRYVDGVITGTVID